jgi:tartrate dehydratase beta subunit/fumarate hydratase class I family protein
VGTVRWPRMIDIGFKCQRISGAYLVSKAIKSSKVLAFEDLGMEAIYEFEVKHLLVTVALGSKRDPRPSNRPRRTRTARATVSETLNDTEPSK